MLSKEQKNSIIRTIGICSLREIYANSSPNSGESTLLINNLWKRCKETFDIQPYRIIDIKDLYLEEELGSGTFGCVKKGIWNSFRGKIPVAVKIIQENSQMFDMSDLRGEVCIFLFIIEKMILMLVFEIVCGIICIRTCQCNQNVWVRLYFTTF